MIHSKKRSANAPAATQDLQEFLTSRALVFHAGWSHEVRTPRAEFHRHTSYELVYHARGSGETSVRNGRSIAYDEGSIVIYPPNIDHDQTHTVPTIDVCIHFGPSDILFKQMRDCLHVNTVTDSLLIDELTSLTRPWPEQTAMESAHLNHRLSSVVALLSSLGATGARVGEPSASSRYVAGAIDFMKRNLETIADIRQVAHPLGISSEYLRHTFKHDHGIGIKQWLIRARLERARNLLLHSRLPLKGIADACGFGTDRYFCSVFKSVEGCTPGEFRTNKNLGR